MNWLSQNWVWIPSVIGANRWLSHLRQQAYQPCPIKVRTDIRHERDDLVRVRALSPADFQRWR